MRSQRFAPRHHNIYNTSPFLRSDFAHFLSEAIKAEMKVALFNQTTFQLIEDITWHNTKGGVTRVFAALFIVVLPPPAFLCPSGLPS